MKDLRSFAHFRNLIRFCTDYEESDGDNNEYTTKYGKCDQNTAGQAQCTDDLNGEYYKC